MEKKELTAKIFSTFKNFFLEIFLLISLLITFIAPLENKIILSYDFFYETNAAIVHENDVLPYRKEIRSILRNSSSFLYSAIEKKLDKFNFEKKVSIKYKNNTEDRPILNIKILMKKDDYSDKIRKDVFNIVSLEMNNYGNLFFRKLLETENLYYFLKKNTVVFHVLDKKKNTYHSSGIDPGMDWDIKTLNNMFQLQNTYPTVLTDDKKNKFFFIIFFAYVVLFSIKQILIIINKHKKLH